MADPITIIGAAGAVANIIDVLGKTINALRELHNRWKEADFIFINLIAQLTALKAALNQIQEWIDSDVVEPYHQLVMDLEVSVSCCRMLIDKMDSQVSELSRKADYTLESKSKMTLIVKSGTLEELQKMVERQTIALTLLLSACSW
jgi:membrane-bound ClpP family serine protease